MASSSFRKTFDEDQPWVSESQGSVAVPGELRTLDAAHRNVEHRFEI